MSFPPAAGIRVTWEALPRALRAAIESRMDARVVAAESQTGGFSPGLASRLRLANGGRVFVKAVSGRTNADSPSLHRREARIAAALPIGAPAPRLRFSLEHDDWVVLAFDDIDGAPPVLPWRSDELDRVLRALHDLSTFLTPSPIDVETVGDTIGSNLMQWRVLAASDDERRHLPDGWEHRLDELCQLECEWPERARGVSLVHLDVRADNVLLTGDRCYFVDWPWAAIGAPWLDLVVFAISVAMQVGPDPETTWRAHPLAAGVASDDVDAFIAAFAGFLTRSAMLPPSPGLPTLRAFQAAQAAIARAWLADRRGWD